MEYHMQIIRNILLFTKLAEIIFCSRASNRMVLFYAELYGKSLKLLLIYLCLKVQICFYVLDAYNKDYKCMWDMKGH